MAEREREREREILMREKRNFEPILIHAFISLSLDRSYVFRKIMSILQLRKLDIDTEKCAIKRVVIVAIRQS